MFDELLAILKEVNYVNEYQIFQLKEKWGYIHIYDNGVPKEVWDKYKAWLKKYEDLSYKTCFKCGKPTKHYTKGWIVPMCISCQDSL